VGVVVRKDDECGTTMKVNDSGGGRYDDVVLCHGGGKMKTRLSDKESDQC
jgi:hypothetical protein